jgi:2,4-dienoyl-CoA reductase-like NADH-dependent reductase (Old Yellow Enzyme family)
MRKAGETPRKPIAPLLWALEFDLVAVGRSLLNDPDWLGKAMRGEPFLPFDTANLARLT